ncbi:MAG: MFS transporter [Woeseia sp.]|nr:MFS transporter [Woeseia sp.]|tara:strand:+ start:2719 stop:4026 length:1308 start_codon:yes stop_codon:yes gene_type:complete
MKKILLWSTAVAVGGFLFGFDTAVISGADQPLQKLWNTSDLVHGAMVMSSALWGTVIGALSAGFICERFGRKKILILVGIFYLSSAIGSALSGGPFFFALMRLVGGFGVGISSIVVPAYIAEIAPAKYRGRLVALYQFQIVFGILIAFLSNFILSEYFSLNWRWMLGVEIIPALIFLIMVVGVPESPRWLLIRKKDEEGSLRILRTIDPLNASTIINEIKSTPVRDGLDRLFSKTYFKPITLAFFVAFFNQISGINFIIYFAPRIFSLAGLDGSVALLSSTGVGVVNLIFTIFGMLLIDNFGRRPLLFIGTIGFIVSLVSISFAFYMNFDGLIVVFFVFLFIASHAIGQGSVCWVFFAEIFPNNVRTKGQSLGSGVHWILAALIALLIPYFLNKFEAYQIFGFFAVMMIFQLFFVLFFMPETRQKTLESLAKNYS